MSAIQWITKISGTSLDKKISNVDLIKQLKNVVDEPEPKNKTYIENIKIKSPEEEQTENSGVENTVIEQNKQDIKNVKNDDLNPQTNNNEQINEEKSTSNTEIKTTKIELDQKTPNKLNLLIAELVKTENTFQKQMSVLELSIKTLNDNIKNDNINIVPRREKEQIDLAKQISLLEQTHKKALEIQKLGRLLFENKTFDNPNDLIELIKSENFKLYVETFGYFANEMSSIQKILSTISKKIPEKYALIEELTKTKAGAVNLNKLDLASLLITPIQRAPRYQLLIKEMASVDNRFDESARIVQALTINLNEQKRFSDEEKNLRKLNKLLEGIDSGNQIILKKTIFNIEKLANKKPGLSTMDEKAVAKGAATKKFIEELNTTYLNTIIHVRKELEKESEKNTANNEINNQPRLKEYLRSAFLILRAVTCCCDNDEKLKENERVLFNHIDPLETLLKTLDPDLIIQN